jgi:type II secretory pathway pseudopilin PulG
MERRAEQQARAVREREEQQRAREKHQALEEHRSQHQDQHQQQAGKMVGDSPVSQPTDQTETGSAGANAIAAEAFLSRMQPTSPGQPAVSQDNTERKPQQQSQKHGAVVKVRGHAIDALSAVVKPALKRYYKSKAITSADDFKHLYAMKAKR